MTHLWIQKCKNMCKTFNRFNRFCLNFMVWQTCLDVLVNLFFEINFSTKLTRLIFLAWSRRFSWWSQCESPMCLFLHQFLSYLSIYLFFYDVYVTRTFFQNHSSYSQISEYELCEYYISPFIFLQEKSCKARKE